MGALQKTGAVKTLTRAAVLAGTSMTLMQVPQSTGGVKTLTRASVLARRNSMQAHELTGAVKTLTRAAVSALAGATAVAEARKT